MDTLLLALYDFPLLCVDAQFCEAFPNAEDVTIEFCWEEPEPDVGFSGGYEWQAYVNGIDVTEMLAQKDIKHVEDALVSYTEAYYG
jgi:hypothetical protein